MDRSPAAKGVWPNCELGASLSSHAFFIFIAGSPNETQSAIAEATQMYHGIES
jgi:hypothetical protein